MLFSTPERTIPTLSATYDKGRHNGTERPMLRFVSSPVRASALALIVAVTAQIGGSPAQSIEGETLALPSR